MIYLTVSLASDRLKPQDEKFARDSVASSAFSPMYATKGRIHNCRFPATPGKFACGEITEGFRSLVRFGVIAPFQSITWR